MKRPLRDTGELFLVRFKREKFGLCASESHVRTETPFLCRLARQDVELAVVLDLSRLAKRIGLKHFINASDSARLAQW